MFHLDISPLISYFYLLYSNINLTRGILKKISIGYLIIASAIIWGFVIVGCSFGNSIWEKEEIKIELNSTSIDLCQFCAFHSLRN
jgi:hypothetical protein